MDARDLLRQVKPHAHLAPCAILRVSFIAAENLLAGKISFLQFRHTLWGLDLGPFTNHFDLMCKWAIEATDCAWRLENRWYATGGAKLHARAQIRRAAREINKLTSAIT